MNKSFNASCKSVSSFIFDTYPYKYLNDLD